MDNQKAQLNLQVRELVNAPVADFNLSFETVTNSQALPFISRNPGLSQRKDTFRVISNAITPITYNPVPKCKEQDTLYVVALGTAGFTAQRIQADNRQERLNEIHRAWNIQVLKDCWSHLVAHPLPEEELFAEFGFIIACRKFVIETAGESREVWDTKVWKVSHGEIKAHQQFISKQEPMPMTLKTSAGKEERIFLLNDKEALHFNLETNDIELIQLGEGAILLTTQDGPLKKTGSC